MKVSTEDLPEKMRNKSDEELFDIFQVHTQDWIPEAVQAARDEFNSRGLDEPKLIGIAASTEQTRKREDARLGWFPRLLAFFISTLFLCIPVLLAHRHFVEKGEKRKAKDWAKWAFYGFLFYLGLAMIGWTLTSIGN